MLEKLDYTIGISITLLRMAGESEFMTRETLKLHDICNYC